MPRRSQVDRKPPNEANLCPEPRTLRFAWRPSRGSARAYALPHPEDQHRIVLGRGVLPGKKYPVVIGLHGQPLPGQAPRSYGFFSVVERAVGQLVDEGSIPPVVLVLPTFRFEGQNWPGFDLVEFAAELERILSRQNIGISGYYVFGHSAAAGCGGDGLNRVDRLAPKAVGFFDTCVGPGFGQVVRALGRQGVPTLILHSLETAGYHPKPPAEYWPDFDFGKVYAPLGLHPTTCPERLPEAPLRQQPFRCAADERGKIRALVIDTGRGQQGHDSVVPIAVRHFLRENLGGYQGTRDAAGQPCSRPSAPAAHGRAD